MSGGKEGKGIGGSFLFCLLHQLLLADRFSMSRSRRRRLVNIASSLTSAFAPCVLLHLYPRSLIRVYLSVTSADGSLLSTCVNAISLALMDAGIALLEPLVAVSIGFYAGGGGSGGTEADTIDADSSSSGGGGTLLLDLNGTEESSLPNLTLGVMPRTGKISLLELETRLHLDRLNQAIRLGAEACGVLKSEMDAVVKSRTKRLAKALGGKSSLNAFDGEDAYGIQEAGEEGEGDDSMDVA